MKKPTIILLLILAIILSACTKPIKSEEGLDIPSQESENIDEEEKQSINDMDEEDRSENNEIDYAKIKPNENGQVMILMYHGIAKDEAEFVRTPQNFRKDLKTLYDKGYRLISLRDYLDNKIKVEAGYTPVILTFDDGLQNQYNLIENPTSNDLDPDCALGILEEFYKDYPDFGRAASFFVYYPIPFRQKDLIKEKFDFLVKNGYEVGNHGYNHENLGKISMDEVQKSLALNVASTNDILEGYNVQALALPYGAAPKGDNYKYVVSGEYEGTSYYNKAVLKVGSNPALAPNHKEYDPSRLPRVRASEMLVYGTGLYDYLEYFDKNPEKRYISDGNENTITIPEDGLEGIDMESLSDKELITYSL